MNEWINLFTCHNDWDVTSCFSCLSRQEYTTNNAIWQKERKSELCSISLTSAVNYCVIVCSYLHFLHKNIISVLQLCGRLGVWLILWTGSFIICSSLITVCLPGKKRLKSLKLHFPDSFAARVLNETKLPSFTCIHREPENEQLRGRVWGTCLAGSDGLEGSSLIWTCKQRWWLPNLAGNFLVWKRWQDSRASAYGRLLPDSAGESPVLVGAAASFTAQFCQVHWRTHPWWSAWNLFP